MGNRNLDTRATDNAIKKAGFTDYTSFLRRTRGNYDANLAVRLRHGRQPPNHPINAQLADAIGISLKRFSTIFAARGKPLSDAKLKMSRRAVHSPLASAERRPAMTSTLIEQEREHASTNGQTKEAATPSVVNGYQGRFRAALDPSRADHALMLKAGIYTISALMKARGTQATSGPSVDQLKARTFPPNHPFVTDFARALQVSEAEFVDAFCVNGTPMADSQVARLRAQIASHPSRRVTSARPSARKVPPHYNKLKGKALSLRQASRSIIMRYTVAAMAGEKAITIPIDALYPFLQDYIELRHIKGAVLISPDFAEQFG